MGLWWSIWRRNFRIWVRRSQKGALRCGGVADEGIYHKPCQSLRSLSAVRLSVFFWLKLNSFEEASKMAQHFMWQEPKLHLAYEGFIFSKWEDWIGLGKYLSVASLVTQLVKNSPANSGGARDVVQSLGWEDPLEKEMATHSGILSWEILWTEEPSGLQSMGSQRVGHDWVTKLSTKLLLIISKTLWLVPGLAV